MQNIAVVGAGTMGNGIAHVFAQNGFKVNLIDISQDSLDKGIATITKNLDRLIQKEKISEQLKSETLSRISTFTTLATGAVGTDLVVEAAMENLALKMDIFRQLDEVCPAETILATKQVDLVAVGRAILAGPAEFAHRVMQSSL